METAQLKSRPQMGATIHALFWRLIGIAAILRIKAQQISPGVSGRYVLMLRVNPEDDQSEHFLPLSRFEHI